MQPSEQDFPELSETTSALLDAWIASRTWRESHAREPLADEHLVEYLAGLLSEAEAAGLEEQLLVDAAGRRALVRVHRRLQELHQRAWSEVLELAEQRDAPDLVARAWTRQVKGWGQAAGRARATWLAEGWEAVKRLGADSAAMTAALAGCREALLGPLQRPLPPALVRGAGPPPESGTSVQLTSAEITAGGALRVRARPAGEPGPFTRYRLELRADPWPLAEGELREGRVEWLVEGFGTVLGLAPAPLALELFAVRPADAPAAGTVSPGVEQIGLQVEGAIGKALGVVPALDLTGPIAWEQGELQVPVALPPELAELPAAWRLALYVRIGAHQQLLAEWRLSECRQPGWLPRALAPVGPGELLPGAIIAVLRADADVTP